MKKFIIPALFISLFSAQVSAQFKVDNNGNSLIPYQKALYFGSNQPGQDMMYVMNDATYTYTYFDGGDFQFGSDLLTYAFVIKNTGQVWAVGYNQFSDSCIKSNIKSLNTPLEKVLSLRGVTFTYKDKTFKDPLPTRSQYSSDKRLIDTTNKQNFLKEIKFKVPEDEKGRQHIGFIAQEIETVLPEIVRTNNGLKSIDYDQVIALLVEAIKEQNVIIENLKADVNELKFNNENKNAQKGSDIQYINAMLFQNDPNPFDQSTLISYYLPLTIKSASIIIYDMHGLQLKIYDNIEKGKSFVSLKSEELNPGMYLYTLIADGKEIDTKRMILLKK